MIEKHKTIRIHLTLLLLSLCFDVYSKETATRLAGVSQIASFHSLCAKQENIYAIDSRGLFEVSLTEVAVSSKKYPTFCVIGRVSEVRNFGNRTYVEISPLPDNLYGLYGKFPTPPLTERGGSNVTCIQQSDDSRISTLKFPRNSEVKIIGRFDEVSGSQIYLRECNFESRSDSIGNISCEKADSPAPDFRTYRDCPECPEMLNIPAGRLLVGEGSAIKSPMDDQSQKWTNISEFAIGKFEITYREWNSIMGSNPKTTSSCGDDCPVVGITWDEAKEFVKALSERTGERYRLPSEVEWEYSARAGTDTAYFWGNSFDPRYANRGKTISPVGCYPSNRYGLFDMHGNASEFVEDAWSDSFSGRPKDRMARSVPTITSRPNRVLKGGSIERPPEYLWSISREEVYTKGDFSGLRVARDPFISFLTYDAVSQSQSAQQNDSESMHGASLSAIYVRKLVAAIRPKIVFNGMLHGNPAAEVEVLAQPNGKITSRRITKSSGRQDWDNAVLLAIDRLRTLPTDANGQAPTKIYLIFRPSEM